MGKHTKGEIGTDILIDTGVDLTGQILQIWFKKPGVDLSGALATTGMWDGNLFGSFSNITGDIGSYFIKYTTADGDLDTAGEWTFQAYVVSTAGGQQGTWWGEPINENILDVLERP